MALSGICRRNDRETISQPVAYHLSTGAAREFTSPLLPMAISSLLLPVALMLQGQVTVRIGGRTGADSAVARCKW